MYLCIHVFIFFPDGAYSWLKADAWRMRLFSREPFQSNVPVVWKHFLKGLLLLSVQNSKEDLKKIIFGELLCNKGCTVIDLFSRTSALGTPKDILFAHERVFFFSPKHVPFMGLVYGGKSWMMHKAKHYYKKNINDDNWKSKPECLSDAFFVFMSLLIFHSRNECETVRMIWWNRCHTCIHIVIRTSRQEPCYRVYWFSQ